MITAHTSPCFHRQDRRPLLIAIRWRAEQRRVGEGTLMKKDKQLLQKANSIQRSMWCTSCGVRTATLIRDRTMMEKFFGD